MAKLTLIILFLLWNTTYTKYNPRNSIAAIPLLGACLGKLSDITPNLYLNFAILGGMVAYLVLNRVGIWQRRIYPQYVVLSTFLKNLPYDGIISDSIIDYHLAYLTRKRVVALTHSPNYNQAKKETLTAIATWNLHYAVLRENCDLEIASFIKTFKPIAQIENCTIYEIPTNKPA